MFCPHCRSLLIPKRQEGRNVLVCSCGYTQAGTGKITEIVGKKKEEIAVVEKEHELLPETEAHCERCGHNLAGYWLVQTRASDEPETKFLRCMKCRYTWREYQ